MQKMPRNAVCEGKNLSLIKPKIGSWRVTWDEPDVAMRYVRCLKESACLETGCAFGYRGVLWLCKKNFVRRGGDCTSCENKLRTFLQLSLVHLFLYWQCL